MKKITMYRNVELVQQETWEIEISPGWSLEKVKEAIGEGHGLIEWDDRVIHLYDGDTVMATLRCRYRGETEETDNQFDYEEGV